jgi:hypothetical protein
VVSLYIIIILHKSFSNFIIETNDSVRQNIILALQTENKTLKNIFIEQLQKASLIIDESHIIFVHFDDISNEDDQENVNPLLG